MEEAFSEGAAEGSDGITPPEGGMVVPLEAGGLGLQEAVLTGEFKH